MANKYCALHLKEKVLPKITCQNEKPIILLGVLKHIYIKNLWSQQKISMYIEKLKSNKLTYRCRNWVPGKLSDPLKVTKLIWVSSVQFSRSVVFNYLRPHESQHARPPCPSTTPRVHSNSHPSSRWCHPAISSSVVPFSSCPQSLPASESFPMS